MKVSPSKLIKQGVRYGIHESELYFDVLEVKQLYPNLKFPPDKIKQVAIGGLYTNAIRPQDIEEMTEFDKNIVQFMRAKPSQK